MLAVHETRGTTRASNEPSQVSHGTCGTAYELPEVWRRPLNAWDSPWDARETRGAPVGCKWDGPPCTWNVPSVPLVVLSRPTRPIGDQVDGPWDALVTWDVAWASPRTSHVHSQQCKYPSHLICASTRPARPDRMNRLMQRPMVHPTRLMGRPMARPTRPMGISHVSHVCPNTSQGTCGTAHRTPQSGVRISAAYETRGTARAFREPSPSVPWVVPRVPWASLPFLCVGLQIPCSKKSAVSERFQFNGLQPCGLLVGKGKFFFSIFRVSLLFLHRRRFPLVLSLLLAGASSATS